MTRLGAASAARSALLVTLLKWLGVGAVAGVLAAASLAAFSPSGVTTTAHCSKPVPAGGRVPHQSRPSLSPPSPLGEVLETPEPGMVPSAAGVVRVPPEPSRSALPTSAVASFASSAPRDTLRVEIALLDETRRALGAGNTAGALAALDRYDSTSSNHALGTEALVLRVRALMAAGRRADARVLAERYALRHPNDAYSPRLRRLVGLPAPAPASGSTGRAPPEPGSVTSGPGPSGHIPSASF